MPAQSVTERSSLALPAVVGPPAFTGRDRELAALTEALAGPPAVVLIEGEAGIGKTRLIQEFLTAPEGRGHGLLVAACPPFRQPHTLGPVVNAIRQAGIEVAAMRLSALAGALRPLFPEWADTLPPAPEPVEDATAARHRLFAALAELLARLEIDTLVTEDAHWADDATLEFLLFLASGPPSPPGTATRPSLVVTVRPEDVPAGSLLLRLSRLAAGSGALRLILGPLDVAGTAELMSSMLASEHVSEEFAGFLHEHTAGVPLAVEESVRLMAARADLCRQDGQWVRRELAALAVPPPVRDAVLERAGQLGPDAQAVLWAAAVLAAPADEATLQSVTEISSERLRGALAQILDCGLLAEDARGLVSFRHALAAQAVYESITGPHRRVLHKRAGETLETLVSPPAERLARHFREADDRPRWLRYGEQAACQALAAGDEASAAVLLHELVTEAGLPSPEVARLAGQMILLALPGDDRLASLAAALRTAVGAAGLTPQLEAGLRFQLGRTLATMQQYDASRDELERAMAGLPPGSLQAVRAMMLLGWAQDGNRPAAEHLRWLRRAAAAEAAVPPAERLRLLVDRAMALLLLGEAEGWAEATRIPWQADTPRDRLQVVRGQANIGEAAMIWGRYTDARRRLEHANSLADRYGYARLRGAGLVTLAHLDWLTGEWEGLGERAAALAADADLQGLAKLEAVLVGTLLRSAGGASGQALAELSQAAEDFGRRGAAGQLMESAAALARLHLTRGDVSQALAVTGTVAEVVARKGFWLWAADLAPARVSALVAVGRAEDAADLVAAFGRGLRGRDAPAPRAGLALCRAAIAEARGQRARAAALFGSAAAAWQALPRPYDALLARERQARCLLAAGSTEAGVSLLTETQRGLSDLGALRDADRVARAMRERGMTVPRVWRGGRRGYGSRLSPRELEVAREAAAGRTNKEIAAALSRSPKTVEMQVYSAMRKLGLPTRAALIAHAAREGLTADGPPAADPGPSR